MFSMFDLDGDKMLSILDLEWLRQRFSPKTELGHSIDKLHDRYLEKNVRPKYVKQLQIIGFQSYFSMAPNISLINDLEFALNVRIPHEMKLNECLERFKNRRQLKAQPRAAPNKSSESFDVLENCPQMDEQEKRILDEYRYHEWSFIKEY